MSTTIVQEPNFSFFHYEELETEFHKGDILHNMSGSDYKVIECYKFVAKTHRLACGMKATK